MIPAIHNRLFDREPPWISECQTSISVRERFFFFLFFSFYCMPMHNTVGLPKNQMIRRKALLCVLSFFFRPDCTCRIVFQSSTTKILTCFYCALYMPNRDRVDCMCLFGLFLAGQAASKSWNHNLKDGRYPARSGEAFYWIPGGQLCPYRLQCRTRYSEISAVFVRGETFFWWIR